MTDVRTYQAATMQEALDLVRRELGTGAVILHTRQIGQRRFLPWRKAKQEVEITAGIDIKIQPAVVRKKKVDQRKANQSTAVTTAMPPARPGFRPDNGSLTPSSETQADKIPRTQPAPQPTNLHQSTQTQALPAVKPSQPRPTVRSTKTNVAQDDPAAQMFEKLDSIHKLVHNLGQSRVGGGDEIPNELFHLYTELIDADVENELARDLIFRLRDTATPTQLADTVAAKALLGGMVESQLRCCGPIVPTQGRRKVVALVGPTGVGKTTTIAKLAANFRLRDGVKMGLVTVDTYRIAAVEQLRTYAEIIDLPMKVVTSPPEMRRALDELTGMDLVLVDTAGRSPRDELKIQELKSLLTEADVDEVHLVLSLTASARSLEATVDKFSTAMTTAMIFTKLDEAAGMGTMLSVSRKVRVPISYLTTGQDVPDDIEPASPSRIAKLALGQDKIFE